MDLTGVKRDDGDGRRRASNEDPRWHGKFLAAAVTCEERGSCELPEKLQRGEEVLEMRAIREGIIERGAAVRMAVLAGGGEEDGSSGFLRVKEEIKWGETILVLRNAW